MLYMDTETNKKSYLEVKTFLDSLSVQFKTFDLKKGTGVIPSQQFNPTNMRYDVMSAIDDINLTTDEKLKILLLLTSIK